MHAVVQRAKKNIALPSRSQECHTVIGDAFGSLLEVAVPCVAVGVREIPTPGKIAGAIVGQDRHERDVEMLAHGARVGRLVGELILGVQAITSAPASTSAVSTDEESMPPLSSTPTRPLPA